MKTQPLFAHSNVTQLFLERDFLQGTNKSLTLAVPLSIPLEEMDGVARKKHQRYLFTMEHRDTKMKSSSNSGKSGKKKEAETAVSNLKQSVNLNDGWTTEPLASPAANFLFDEADESDSEDELHMYRGLVLDLSYRPINVVCWKRALCLEILEKADVLEYYDQVVHSPTRAFPIPAVLRVSGFIHSPKQKTVRLGLSRNNIFLRDKFKCQYCNAREDLTIDHVRAVSRGGGWEWNNLVTACSTCNVKKGDKTLEEAHMKLMKLPKEPRELDSLDLPPNYKTFRILTRHRSTPVQWHDYLPNRPPLF